MKYVAAFIIFTTIVASAAVMPGRDDRAIAQVQQPAPAAPAAPTDFLSMIQTIFLGLVTALLGKIAFVPGKGMSGSIDKKAIDQAVLQAVQSGVPGQLVQGGLGMIPVVGPVASGLEPVIRQLGIQALQARIAGTDPLAGLSAQLPNDPAALAAHLHDIVQQLEKTVAGFPKAPAT